MKYYEQVSCGGCHTLVSARPVQQNGDALHDEEKELDEVDFGAGEPTK